MKLKKILFLGCLFASVLVTSCDKDNDDELNQTDRNFMVAASISNTAEVDAATLAVTKATNAAVKAFAQNMLMEHGMAQTDLKNLGTSVGNMVKDTLDPAHVTIKAQLTALSGRAFDSAYMYVQVADHQTTINNFKTEQTNGQHQSVKSYADSYRPHIEMHFQRADSITKAYFKKLFKAFCF